MVDKEPACQSGGSQSIHCKNCNATKDSQMLPRVDHKFANYVLNHGATCTKDGTKTAAYEYGCGNIETLPDDGSMLEHDYEWTYSNDAACEKNGTATGNSGFGYKILEGENQTYSGSLTVRANGDFSKFTGIKVDGDIVDASNYDAKSGSTVVTLKENYLSALSAGDHTLTFVYSDGEISTNFTTAERGTSCGLRRKLENNPVIEYNKVRQKY